MLFISVQFLFFFIVVTSLYFALPHKYRWFLLLAASCYFYMAFVPIYILILGFTIVIDYFAGQFIEQAEGKRRKIFLVCSLVANIGVLAVFKYYNFLNDNFNFLLHGVGTNSPLPYLKILLPIGLSFHTFQAMSYTIEVYRGNQKAERHFGIYALYVMFYPQLVAGPIERPQNLLHQFKEQHTFDYDRVTSGIRLMIWGVFKKVVIADRLGIVVDQVYNDPHSYGSPRLIIATAFFCYQIYCDFSAYSDIAIGAARVMGFKLMMNFNQPFHSKSIAELWTRWHISLATWFRDYLYIPMGGSRVKVARQYFNLMFLFLICGLWHGASWTFVIWGGLQAVYIIFGLVTKRIRDSISRKIPFLKLPILSIIATFILFAFAAIFFRETDISTALYIAKKIFSGIPEVIHNLFYHPAISSTSAIANAAPANGLSSKEIINLIMGFAVIIFLEVAQFLQSKFDLKVSMLKIPRLTRWTLYLLVLYAIGFLGVFAHRQFIYYQF
jgi:alginate O-acetyltransferase complex protein AlgI